MKKEAKAFFLFEELSGVSEERLEEARLYGIRRRNLQRFRRSLAVLAAALAVSLVVLVGVPAFRTWYKDFLDRSSPNDRSPEILSEEEVEGRLFSGEPMLVRQKEGSEVYEAVVLSKSQFETISREMENPEGEIPPEEGEVRNQKLWVLSGNGTVFTPCLKKSEGNLHFSLFDYRNEVVPNQALQNLFGELFEEGDE